MTAARWILLSTALAALLVFWLRPKAPTEAWLQVQKVQLEASLTQVQDKITADLAQLAGQAQAVDFFRRSLKPDAPYLLYVYQSDSLVYWSGESLNPTVFRDQLAADASVRFFWHNQQYLAGARQITEQGQEFLALTPIWQPRQLKSSYLPAGFVSWLELPDQLQLSPTAQPNTLELKHQNAWLGHSNAPIQRVSNWMLGLSMLIVLVGLLWLLTILAEYFGQRWGILAQWGTLLGGIALIRWLTFDLPAKWGLPLFQDSLEGLTVANSTGALLLHSCLLFFVVSYAARQDWRAPSTTSSNRWRALLPIAAIVLSMTLLLQLTQTILLSTGLRFDFDHLLLLDRTQLVVLFSLILLFIAHFLLGYWQYRRVRLMGLTQRDRLLMMGAALLPGLLLYWLLPLQLSLWVWLLIHSTLLVLFDLFFEREQPGLTWLVVWLLVYAALCTGLLFSFSLKSDTKQRLAYAEVLTQYRDSVALHHAWSILDTINKLPDSLRATAVKKAYENNRYLYSQYHLTQEFCPKVLGGMDCQGIGKGQVFQPSTRTLHYVHWDSLMVSKKWREGQVFLRLQRRKKPPARIHEELVAPTAYRELSGLDFYQFALLEGDQLVWATGTVPDQWPKLGNREWVEQRSRTRAALYYQGDSQARVVISRPLGGYLAVFSLFSYLLLLFLMVMIGLFLLHQVLPVLPFSQEVRLLGTPSLRNRIQLAVILLTVSSFVIIGVVTVLFFQNSSREYHEGRLQRKVSAVLRDLEQEIERYPERASRFSRLQSSIEEVSVTHNLDVHLYGLDGQLLETSAPFVFEQGLFAPLLSSTAFQQLKKNPSGSFIQNEQLGDFNYRVAYVPLLDEGVPLAYLGLPYYANNRNLRRDVFKFMGTLLNVYVFLLLIAGVIAIAVANSIARPITEIGQKLSSTRLGQNNPLQYQREDELGELIKSYNAMIRQIEESAVKLAQSEREGAWREMAKQVAHEIKNPLTPMKLSIQYLQRAYESDPARAQPLVERVSRTLIEQIDSLSRIASNFSNFAKMPVANNEVLSLNELVASVYDLFRDEQNDRLRITFESTPRALSVFADKDHLQRVLNNLVTNAIQAIPEDRKGEIDLLLYTEGTTKAIIEVKDNGKGIPEEQYDKVFVPNFTTKSSGTGLGLAISQGIIEALSGRIYFETEPGVGTSFFVELPVVSESRE